MATVINIDIPLLQKMYRSIFMFEEKITLVKGDRGIIGGSESYTGAPFFVASAAENIGVDIVYIFCHPSASVPIKCYSPTFIVQPIFKGQYPTQEEKKIFLRRISSLDAIVLGPGCSLDEAMQEIMIEVITLTKKLKIALVVDADVFRLPSNLISTICDHPLCFMTPNLREFNILKKKINYLANTLASVSKENKEILNNDFHYHIFIVEDKLDSIDKNNIYTQSVIQSLSSIRNYFRIPAIILKDENDVIILDKIYVVTNVKGSRRRCGGIGDILAGIIGGILCFLKRKYYTQENYIEWFTRVSTEVKDEIFIEIPQYVVPLCLGITVIKLASRFAEENKKGYITASDVLNYLGIVMFKLTEENSQI